VQPGTTRATLGPPEPLDLPMTRYFDISDLVRFARANPTLSGIQRVQVRLLHELVTDPAGRDDRCVYAPSRFARVRACRARDLFTEAGYDAASLLAALGVEPARGGITRRELAEHLARFPAGSVGRAVRKASLQAFGRVAPTQARAWLGLPPAAAGGRSVPPMAAAPVRALRPTDQLVLIGTNWNVSGVTRLAERHRRAGGEVVQVVYDLIPHVRPEYCAAGLGRKFDRFLARSLRATSRYVCISEATRRDLEAYLGRQGRSIETHAWPLAHEFEGYARNSRGAMASDPLLEARTGEPFVLCVGTIEIRKNGIALLRAWQRLLADGGPAPLLVFAGKPGWKTEAFHELLAADPAVAARAIIVPRPTDADLANLYQRCLFTAYPSLAEGWGLPVGEAAWFGKYSVVSSRTSLPEVCGNLVDYVDPDDIAGLARALRRAIQDDGYRRDRERGIERAMLRTWADAARDFDRLLDASPGGLAST